MEKENLISIVPSQIRADMLDLGTLAHEAYGVNVPTFEESIYESTDPVTLQNHLGAYPIFRAACTRIFEVVGGVWAFESGRPLFIQALDQAVREGTKFQKNYKPTLHQIQIELIKHVADVLSRIANFNTVGVTYSGEITRWNPADQHFFRWSKNLQNQRFYVLEKHLTDEVLVEGLRIRLLCLTLDDRSLAFALYRRN